MEKRVTKTALKSFINKNRPELYINVKSEYDGMIDCLTNVHGRFQKAKTENDNGHNLGIENVFVTERTFFNAYEDDDFIGIEYYNCCGGAIIAIKKAA